jgi:hypothetical protein
MATLFRWNQSALPAESFVFAAAKHPDIVVACWGGPKGHANGVKALEVVAARESLDSPVGALFVQESLPDLGLLNLVLHFFGSLPAPQCRDG